MPHLLFRGVPAPSLRSIAPELVQELAVLCDCGVDNFTIECLATTSIYGGLADDCSFPFIEIGWFERGQEVRDRFAAIVHRYMERLELAEAEIAFRTYSENAYYIEGKPFSS
ncbi:DUF1904 family protein [Paenibacillus sp. Leaf72]|uniref:DUF1904 family protein n=1 Tax=Paenibacillus sp. Leaf72 TaxID=1736234 RepID=UPI0006F1DF3A|nr:DUF1904 family protein [Paenibacillus sp. Leaf72]KQN99103.1 hypothetical protein ASF12_20255 [Paenibacillus sp. Leaf72]